MENTSKALIIAGEILFAIIVLSVGVFIYISFQEGTKPYNKTLTNKEIESFNNKFLQYINSDNTIKAQDIVTIRNLAENSEEIKVTIKIMPDITNDEVLKNNVGGSEVTKYKVTKLNYYEKTDNNPYIIGAIKNITIEKQ